MKKSYLLLAIIGLVISCSKDKKEDELTQDVAFQMFVSVNWQIDLLTVQDDVLTSEFTDYKFDFNSDNHVVANDGTNVNEGTWYVIDNNNSDSEGGLTVHINFESPEAFTGLSNDWSIISATQEMIRLKYIGESSDYLTISRISN